MNDATRIQILVDVVSRLALELGDKHERWEVLEQLDWCQDGSLTREEDESIEDLKLRAFRGK